MDNRFLAADESLNRTAADVHFYWLASRFESILPDMSKGGSLFYKESKMQKREKKKETSLSTIVIRFVVSFAAIYFFWKLLLLAGR